jgi:1,4-alpha-glucan branching enzyme
MNHLMQNQPALYEQDFHPDGFQWIEPNDNENSIYSFIRYARDRDDFLVIVCNCTPIPRTGYRIGVPAPGHYAEALNSDSEHYGGSNTGNNGGVDSSPRHWHAFPHSIDLTVPPLGVLVLKLDSQIAE